MIDDLMLDCLISCEITLESEVSEFPVESGGFITDNVRTGRSR